MSSGNTTVKRIQFVTYLHANRINAMSAVLFSLHSSIGLKRCRLLYQRSVRKSIKQRAQMVLTHQQHQQQHLSHLDRVGIVFQKYRVRFQKPQVWENLRGNPNRIKYQSYTGVWVNYTVKKPKKSWFWWMGLELSYTSYF